jgi:hypothetical protein
METNNSLYSELKEKILHLAKYAWSNRIEWPDVTNWLDNFEQNQDETKDEQLQMLYLLGQFMYFGSREMRELLRSIYRDKYKYKVVEAIRKNNNDTTNTTFIQESYDIELLKTRFLGVGNPSESGTHLLYYFRQETGLGKDQFINSHEVIRREGGKVEIRDATIKHYVFIDDLCGSGQQACDYSKDIVSEIKTLNPDAIVSYYVLFAMSDGIAKVNRESKFDVVDCVYELDNTFRCFGGSSRHFNNIATPISRVMAKSISDKYGRRICPSDPLGYEDCQLLLGFFHNTPDNSLPVIWSDETVGQSWTPIFRRYNKKYGWGL